MFPELPFWQFCIKFLLVVLRGEARLSNFLSQFEHHKFRHESADNILCQNSANMTKRNKAKVEKDYRLYATMDRDGNLVIKHNIV